MKKAIVVGASSGIGFELSKILADNNYKVGVVGRRKERLIDLKNTNFEKIFISSFDCTSIESKERLLNLANLIGGLDLFVMSAGVGFLNADLDGNLEKKTNDLNVVAFTEMILWAYNYFKKQSFGHIVVVTSVAGARGNRFAPAYNASKAYQINYIEGLRQKLNKENEVISLTDVRPGYVNTKMAQGDKLFWVSTKRKAARQIFNLIKRKKSIGYVSRRWYLIYIFLKIIPNNIFKRL
ncbi:MAG: SDR family NAD(P)-dependent oxidoreductase [Winogradskyella sp.]